jgi:hemolysin activation/secretion protein
MYRTLLMTLFLSAVFAEERPWISAVESITVVEESEKIDLTDLQLLIDSQYIGASFDSEKAAALKKTISQFYEERDFLVESVTIPPQDVTEGEIVVNVSLSKVGTVTFVGNRHFSDRLLAKYFRSQEGDEIRLDRITSDLSWMNRNPYRRTGAVLNVGNTPGTTDIELITQDRTPFSVYYGWDDRGNDSIGLYRQFAGFSWGKFLGTDQTLAFQFTNSSWNSHLYAYFVDYEAPLPWRHLLSIYGGYSEVRSKKFAEFFHNRGKTASGSLRYTIPVTWTENAIHEFSIGSDYKFTNNNLLFSEVPLFSRDTALFQFSLSWSVDVKSTNGQTYFWIELFGSPFTNTFPHQTKGEYDTLRPYAKVRYLYGQAEFEKNWILPRNFCLRFRALGQAATTNLLPSEQLGLGGADTVRGYRERIFNADSGAIANLELAFPPFSFLRSLCSACSACSPCSFLPEIPTPKAMDRMSLYLFADYAYGCVYHKLIDSAKSESLVGVGPGLKYVMDPYLSLQADWGFRLREVQLEESIGGRLHFQAIARF